MTTRPSQSPANLLVLAASEQDTISRAASILLSGGVIAIPTDTVYGLAAALTRPDAIDRIYLLKSRPANKAIPVLVSDFSQVSQIAMHMTPELTLLAKHFWPGALTLVVEACDHLPPQVTATDLAGKRSVAVRLPNHPITRQIIDAAGGALAVSSANRSGEPDAIAAQQVRELSIAKLDVIVDGGRVPTGAPSTIVSVVASSIAILRDGAIPAGEIFSFLRSAGYGSRAFPDSAV